MFKLDLTVSKVYKSFKDYKFWMQQSQIRKVHPTDWESSLDYLASGLRELPLEIKLLYNYACVNEKIGNYQTALQFFDFAMEIRPRWTDALFGKAVTYFKLGHFKQSKKCVKTAIHNYKNDSFEKLAVMQYFQAMCYKNLGKF
jgi:tetratricopeptide (TPR) repeat protein